MTKDKDADGGFSWQSVSHPYAVLRIFPEIADLGVGHADELFPGRYWRRWEPPYIETDLDKEVSKLINGNNGLHLLPRNTLEDRGIVCPYYAVRMHTLRAVMHGRISSERLGRDRLDKLIRERKRWSNRIDAAEEILLNHKSDDVMKYGSLNLNIEDFDEGNWLSIENARNSKRESLKLEIIQDRDQITIINDAIYHINSVKNESTSHLWLTPFYIYMASLWVMLTGGTVPAETAGDGEVPFYSFLKRATKVIGGGEHYRSKWGQSKTLIERFRNSPSGKGFLMHEDGSFSLEQLEAVAFRGDEMRIIIESESRITPYRPIYIALLKGMIALRDYNGECLEMIMKELVLRPIADRLDASSARLRVQLGWVVELSTDEIVKLVRQAARSAIQGDRAASAVLSVASSIDGSINDFLYAAGLYDGVYRYSFDELCSDYEDRRSHFTSDGVPELSDDKAFAVAINIIQFLEDDFCNSSFK